MTDLKYYEWLVNKGRARIVNVHKVWSNGTKIRRYQGQGEGNVWHSPEKGYRKMTAILIEEVYE